MMRWVLVCALAASAVRAAAYEVGGSVVDAQGNAIAEAGVWLTQERVTSTVTTDSSGRFSFPAVQPGPALFVALKDGYAFGGLTAHILGPDTVALALGEPAELRLRVTDHTVNPVQGRQFRPVEGARVQWIVVEGAFAVPVGDLVGYGFPSFRSDAEGRLSVGCAPRASYVSLVISHRELHRRCVPE